MLAAINDVPWESLAAGDRVHIHWRATSYKEKWVICRQGTAEAPIVVSGMPGPVGQLPVIDGSNAVTRTALSFWNESRGVIKIGGASIPADTLPAHIVIENLDIRSGRPPHTFSNDSGGVETYADNAAAIYVEKAEHLTIRNCIIRDSGNGLFIGAYDGLTKDILIERNWIYDNGIEGSYLPTQHLHRRHRDHLPVQPPRPAPRRLRRQQPQRPFSRPRSSPQLDRRRQSAARPGRCRGQRRPGQPSLVHHHVCLRKHPHRVRWGGQQPDPPLRRRQRYHRRLPQRHPPLLPQHRGFNSVGQHHSHAPLYK